MKSLSDQIAAGELEYVGFWLRVWASVIDTFLMGLLLLPLMFMLYLASGVAQINPDDYDGPVWTVASWLLPALAVLAFWVARQATPGKMAIRARIVDAQSGAEANLAQLLARYVGYFVSTVPLGLGLLWVGFDPRKQGWHDKMAGTVVVRDRQGPGGPITPR